MALGFKIPQVKFLSISLGKSGETDLFKKTDEPHIDQSGDLSYTSAIANANDDAVQAPKKMDVEVLLAVQVGFDVTSDNIYSTFLKNDFTKYLRIKVSQTTNASDTQQLLQTPYAAIGQDAIYADFSYYLGEAPELAEEFANSIEVKYDKSGNKIYVFPYKFNFSVFASAGGTKTDHLAYFAHAYIDIDEIATDEGLFGDIELPQGIVEQLSQGSVSFQQVIESGTANSFSQEFYVTNTNELWTGPVHYHGAENPGPNDYVGYMAGTGGNDMGPLLTSVAVPNNVIQDFREIIEIEKLSFDYSLFSNSWFNQETTERLQNNIDGIKKLAGTDNPYMKDVDDIEEAIIKSLANSKPKSVFGDFYSAMDGAGNTRYIFSLNMKEVVKQNTAFPKLVDYLFQTNETAQQLLNQKLVKDFKVYRHRVYEENPADPSVDIYEEVLNETPKLVVSSAENDEGVLISAVNTVENSDGNQIPVGSVKEIDLDIPLNDDSPYEVKFYTGVDLDTPIDGDYIFSVEMNIKDPIIPWMMDRINELQIVLYGFVLTAGLKDYLSVAKEDPKYYNLYTNRFTSAGIDALEQKFGQGFASNKITEFFQILEKFSSFDEDIYGAYSLLTTISSLQAGNPSGVETVFNVLETIYNKILKVFSSASKYKKPVDAPQVGSDGKGQSVYLTAGSNPRRDFTVKHKFNTEIKGEINHLTGYDYLSINSTNKEDGPIQDGLKTLSFEQYNNRVNIELQKLFPVFPDDAAANIIGDVNVASNMLVYKEPLADVVLEDTGVGEQINDLLYELFTTDGQIKYYEEQVKKAEQELEDFFDESIEQGGSGGEGQLSVQEYKTKQNEIKNKISNFEQNVKTFQQTYSNIQQQIIDLKKQLPAELQSIQGIPLNPDDSVDFTKYAYLSPSIINFEKSPSFSLINSPNNPEMPTDLNKLDNALLNIIKHNFNTGQVFDFPKVSVATGVGSGNDKIIQPDQNNEKKYDLLTLMNLQQTSVYSNASDDSGGVVKGTRLGGFIGSATYPEGSETFDSTDIVELLESASDSEQYNPVSIFESTINPSSALFASLAQQFFKVLSTKQWTWDYYVKNFEETFYEEYLAWGILTGVDSLLNDNADSYTISNSPLKRAPNHVKALMLHLDYTKSLKNPAFNIFKEIMKSKKPHAFNYQPTGEYIESTSLNVGPEDYFGMPTDALKMYGTTTFKQIEPKNKVIYQNPEFLSFFLLNYKNIVKIEFLTGFGLNKNDQLSINQPMWNELTFELVQTMVQRQGKILCRMLPYEKEFYGVKRHDILELPFYNEHFIIDFANFSQTLFTSGPAPEPTREDEQRTPPVRLRAGDGRGRLVYPRTSSERDSGSRTLFGDRPREEAISTTQPEDRDQSIPTSIVSNAPLQSNQLLDIAGNNLQQEDDREEEQEGQGNQTIGNVIAPGTTPNTGY